MPEQPKLRVAQRADISGITALIQASVRVLQAGDYSAAQIEASLQTIFTIDTQLIEDQTYFVIEHEARQLIACGGWSKRKTLYGGNQQLEIIQPELLDPSTDAAKIRAIFVHPDHARKGLGTTILQAAETAARAAGFSKAEMGSTLTGLALYRLKGYVECERHQVPVSPTESIGIVRMTKSLVP